MSNKHKFFFFYILISILTIFLIKHFEHKLSNNFFFLISKGNFIQILNNESPKYTRSIQQGIKIIKYIYYKYPSSLPEDKLSNNLTYLMIPSSLPSSKGLYKASIISTLGDCVLTDALYLEISGQLREPTTLKFQQSETEKTW